MKVKDGPCACCPRIGRRTGHHDHLRDEVRIWAMVIMTLVIGREAAVRLFKRRSRWTFDPRVQAICRSESEEVCWPCNSMDSVDTDRRPGHRFSLSPDEMRSIRDKAGHARNEGAAFLAALDAARRAAATEYERRFRRAGPLGVELAWEWLRLDVPEADLAQRDWESSMADAEFGLWLLTRDRSQRRADPVPNPLRTGRLDRMSTCYVSTKRWAPLSGRLEFGVAQ